MNEMNAKDAEFKARFPRIKVLFLGDPTKVHFEGHWSNPKAPPELDTRVRVMFNGFGMGSVAGYFEEDGWLGCLVQIDKQPDWHLKQNGVRTIITAFGAELDY